MADDLWGNNDESRDESLLYGKGLKILIEKDLKNKGYLSRGGKNNNKPSSLEDKPSMKLVRELEQELKKIQISEEYAN